MSVLNKNLKQNINEHKFCLAPFCFLHSFFQSLFCHSFALIISFYFFHCSFPLLLPPSSPYASLLLHCFVFLWSFIIPCFTTLCFVVAPCFVIILCFVTLCCFMFHCPLFQCCSMLHCLWSFYVLLFFCCSIF